LRESGEDGAYLDYIHFGGLSASHFAWQKHFNQFSAALLSPKSKSPAKKQDFVDLTDLFSNQFVKGLEGICM
jgi:hypothetical protein